IRIQFKYLNIKSTNPVCLIPDLEYLEVKNPGCRITTCLIRAAKNVFRTMLGDCYVDVKNKAGCNVEE
ncbi:hypothetical protein, partial [Vibrio splendidus]|uniref:hypothetical protein n=1 Tax=Vibrio splendidus TaxID=29497 RepID=UPI0004943518